MHYILVYSSQDDEGNLEELTTEYVSSEDIWDRAKELDQNQGFVIISINKIY